MVENERRKNMTSKNIQDKIDEFIEIKNNIERIEKQELNDVNFMTFKKYLEIENVAKVAEFLNNQGYRKENNTKYTSNDVSAIIQTKESIKDEWLYKFVNDLFKNHKKCVNKRYN